MRKILMFTMLLFVAVSIKGQDIKIEAQDKGTEVVLMATNNENTDVTVTVDLDAQGYDIGSSNKIEVLIPKNKTIEVGRFKRDNSPTASFKYGYSLTQTTTTETKQSSKSTRQKKSTMSETLNAQIEDASLKNHKGLYVYSINKCGRCNYTTKFLKSNNIEYTEKNMDENENYNSEAFEYLKATGYEGRGFQTPLIVHDGKISYNIKDLKVFLKELK